MTPRAAVSLVAVLAMLGGAGYLGWRYVSARNAESCRACTRPVHDHSRTIAAIDGKRGVYCCPACALSEHRQTGKNVDVLQLTDHLSGAAIEPERSFVVRNSDVNPCLEIRGAVSADKQPMHSHFDRCAPGILAFRDQASARAFAARHGGDVTTFPALASEFRR